MVKLLFWLLVGLGIYAYLNRRQATTLRETSFERHEPHSAEAIEVEAEVIESRQQG